MSATQRWVLARRTGGRQIRRCCHVRIRHCRENRCDRAEDAHGESACTVIVPNAEPSVLKFMLAAADVTNEGGLHVSIRSALVTAVAALPASELKNSLLRRLGWVIGDGVRIGPCLVSKIDHVDIGDGAWIGPFNVVRDLAALTIGEHAGIVHWNWVTASRPLREAGGAGLLHLGPHSAITSRHYIDCSGGIRVGTHTTIAGERSTLLTHGISWKSSAQTFSPIEIGDYCLISSNVKVAPGAIVGNRIVVGMGATIAGRLLDPGLYVQPRATLVKSDLDGEYFRREEGHIGTIQARA
jgi:acetyltransferase-like isoleucine patch superfamily enzyme